MSTESEPAGVKRRDFLKVVGAAGATTALVGCGTSEVERLIPYLVSPDQTVPGVSTYYATTCRECAAACGVIAETRDGRAIKLEGNPAHPLNRGALCARGQSALQGLYNPDRFRGPMLRQPSGQLEPTTWEVALKLFASKVAAARGAGDAAFVNQHETGSFPAFLDQWLAGQGMPPHISYDAEADAAVIAANRQSYGVAWPRLDFGAAKLIVSFGADFLDTWGASVPQQLDFADARAKLADAPRFIYVGARRSLTGLNADDWIPAKAGSELAIVQALSGGDVTAAATASGVPAETLQRLAQEIAAARPSLLLAGTGGAGALELATAVNAFNQRAGNVGLTVKPADALLGFEHMAAQSSMRDLAERMKAGRVSVIMVRGANPVFTTPKSLGFAAAMRTVPFKVSFSSMPDETTALCDLILPDHHSLEQWGDAEPVAGTLSLQQPVMERVFATRATSDVLIAIARGDATSATGAPAYAGTDYRSWLVARFPGGAAALTAALPTGIVRGSVASPAATRSVAPRRQAAAPAAPASGDFSLVVYPSPVLGDGRGGNKPWLQELPDPVSKICWQSWVEVHPEAARRLGVEAGDLLTVETSSGSVTAPAFPYLGVRPDTVAISLGRGHTAYGRYASDIGVNPLDLLSPDEDAAGGLTMRSATARVRKAGGHVELVTTEGSARQHGRGIAQALLVTDLRGGGTQAPAEHAGDAAAAGEPASEHGGEHEYVGDASHAFLPGLRSPVAADAQGDLANPASKEKGMYDPQHWSGMAKRRWAMTIDLARCTGCSACMTACYAENNIPTVGAPWQGAKVLPDRTGAGANILRSREMTWIRLERYFEGAEHEDGHFDPDFESRFVPMLCQHCGNAPCEPVCPVYATYHAPDGLNVQVYNRCVGTRYCSNNCPYKVRYFNWFGYGEPARAQYAFPEPLHMQLNPDVTVRGKGVMEKCSFCVQRIRETEHLARLEDRPVAPDEFTVACAQACPSRAIVFGDAADPRWTVAQQVDDHRAYHVFEELNTFTAVVYLKKVTHPAPGQAPRAAGGAH